MDRQKRLAELRATRAAAVKEQRQKEHERRLQKEQRRQAKLRQEHLTILRQNQRKAAKTPATARNSSPSSLGSSCGAAAAATDASSPSLFSAADASVSVASPVHSQNRNEIFADRKPDRYYRHAVKAAALKANRLAELIAQREAEPKRRIQPKPKRRSQPKEHRASVKKIRAMGWPEHIPILRGMTNSQVAMRLEVYNRRRAHDPEGADAYLNQFTPPPIDDQGEQTHRKEEQPAGSQATTPRSSKRQVAPGLTVEAATAVKATGSVTVALSPRSVATKRPRPSTSTCGVAADNTVKEMENEDLLKGASQISSAPTGRESAAAAGASGSLTAETGKERRLVDQYRNRNRAWANRNDKGRSVSASSPQRKQCNRMLYRKQRENQLREIGWPEHIPTPRGMRMLDVGTRLGIYNQLRAEAKGRSRQRSTTYARKKREKEIRTMGWPEHIPTPRGMTDRDVEFRLGIYNRLRALDPEGADAYLNQFAPHDDEAGGDSSLSTNKTRNGQEPGCSESKGTLAPTPASATENIASMSPVAPEPSEKDALVPFNDKCDVLVSSTAEAWNGVKGTLSPMPESASPGDLASNVSSSKKLRALGWPEHIPTPRRMKSYDVEIRLGIYNRLRALDPDGADAYLNQFASETGQPSCWL